MEEKVLLSIINNQREYFLSGKSWPRLGRR